MPLYYNPNDDIQKAERLTLEQHIAAQRARKKPKTQVPASQKPRVSQKERIRRQAEETKRLETTNPELTGRKAVPTKTGVGEKVLVKNPIKTPPKAKPRAKPKAKPKDKPKDKPKTKPKAKPKAKPKPKDWVNPNKRKPQIVGGGKGQGEARAAYLKQHGHSTTRGTLNTVNQSLDTIQGTFQGMLAVLKVGKLDTSIGGFRSLKDPKKRKQDKTNKKRDLKRQTGEGSNKRISEGMGFLTEVKQSLDNQMDKLRKSRDGALPKGNIVSEPDPANTKEGQATGERISNAGRGGKFRHSKETKNTGSLHNAKFRE